FPNLTMPEPLPTHPAPLSRRSFLISSTALAAASLLRSRTLAAGQSPGGLFSLGVASGEPAPDGFVIWTRLAPAPREPDGGMTSPRVEVRWEVAEDEGMTRVVQQGTSVAEADWAHSVHVEVANLDPD